MTKKIKEVTTNRDLNLGAISKEFSHFWAGSLDVHNMTSHDYVANHPAIVDFAWNEVDAEAFNSMLFELLKKYNLTKNGRKIVGDANLKKKFFEDYEIAKVDLTCKLFNNCMLFTKAQVNQIFNIVWLIVGDIAKENKVAYPGFRFATNGGRSVSTRSVSVCTLHFLFKKTSETFEDMIKRCCSPFLHYVYWMTKGSTSDWNKFTTWRDEQVVKKIAGKFNYLNQFFTNLV